MKNKYLKICFILLMTSLITIGLFYFMKNNVQAEGKEGKVTEKEIASKDSPVKDTDTGTWEALPEDQNSFTNPTLDGFEIYCIQPNSSLLWNYDIRYDERYNGNYSAKEYEAHVPGGGIKPYISAHYHASKVGNGYQTLPVYEVESKGKLSPAAAYIMSADPMGEWTEEKQKALWNLRKNGLDDGLVIGDGISKFDGPSIYDENAAKYAEYYEKIMQNRDAGKPALDPKNNTDTNDVYMKVDTGSGTYTVGPANVSYTKASYDGITFGGITEIYVIGYNKDGEIAPGKEKIPIKSFSTPGGEEKTPRYFTPTLDSNGDGTGEDTGLYIDKGEQIYPEPDEDFDITFEDPNKDLDPTDKDYDKKYVTKIKVKITFQYMLAEGEYAKLKGTKYTVQYTDSDGVADHECPARDEYGNPIYDANGDFLMVPCGPCQTTCYLAGLPQQYQISVKAGRKLYEAELEFEWDKGLSMQLAGYVWVDGSLNNKESTPYDGKNTEQNDVPLPNIKVILYTASGDKVAEKTTDSEGTYIFSGLNSMAKYFVAFEYNGQLYVPTTYKAGNPEYNTKEWRETSKATEKQTERDALNKKFSTINAYPENYSGGKVYSMKQLVEAGVIDSFYEVQDGIITEIDQLNKATSGPDSEQQSFINDCQIKAYTKAIDKEDIGSYDLYPVYDKFIINSNGDFATGSEARKASLTQGDYTTGGKTFNALYPGQFFIDLGLVRRRTNDLALRKDVYRAATKINGKTEVYKYNGRPDVDDENAEKYWEIKVRVEDKEYDYYDGIYNRPLYKADYEYDPNSSYGTVGGVGTAHGGSALEVYVTYKITIRNQSQNIENKVIEVADHYDPDYEYVDDLSWVMYSEGEDDNLKVDDNEYYAAIHTGELDKIKNTTKKPIEASTKEGDNTVYVHGLKDKQLKTGEKAYIYLTFKVSRGSDGKLITDEGEETKYNVAEINGYTSFYSDNSGLLTELPNGIKKGSGDYAGLIDIDSVPGNVAKDNLTDATKYEDDTDRAKGIKIYVDSGLVRTLNGMVWDDSRNKVINAQAIIGDGVRNENSGISDIKVELVEKLNGKDYVWTTTTVDGKTNKDRTNKDGTYEFINYIPGDYIIRFTYGGEYNQKYNGQDYKSTIYQVGIDQNGRTNYENASDKLLNLIKPTFYYGYTDFNKQNESGTYGYSITKTASSKDNVSDAKDIWSAREDVNKFSSNNYNGVTNELAQTLANVEKTKGTQMVAETGVITVEGECNELITDTDKVENSNYHINNVDLGLTERPKAQLELDKHVAKVKVTLANGSTLYDAVSGIPNLSWTSGQDYDLLKNGKYYNKSEYKYNVGQNEIDKLVGSLYNGGKNGLIQAIIDSELMHGATIRIEYTVTVKNAGEVDYTGTQFYYLGEIGDGAIVTTSAGTVVDYISNNMQFRTTDNNSGQWNIIPKESLVINEAVKNKINNITIIESSGKNKDLTKELKPTETASTTLILTQTITAQNTTDDMTYDNIAEITKYYNTVGRRMAYSVVGNQDPATTPAEVDSAGAEKVIILPPFGHTYMYIGITIAALAIVVIGIILIKKKVLKK